MPHKLASFCNSLRSIPNFGNSIADYEVINLIGRGAFACVYRAKCKRSGRYVAIKMIDKRSMKKSGMVARVRSEVEIQAQLKHPSILELHHCFEDSDHVYLVLELCIKGELSRFLKSQGNFLSEDQGIVQCAINLKLHTFKIRRMMFWYVIDYSIIRLYIVYAELSTNCASGARLKRRAF